MALSRNKKIGIAVALLILAGFIIWYVWFSEPSCDTTRPGFNTKGEPSDKCKAVQPASTDTTPVGESGGGIQWIPEAWPLRKGMWGDKIKILQQKLKIKDDGKFWTKTQEAVQAKIGKTEVSEADYEKIVNPPATGGGINYASLKQALGSSAKNFSGGVYIFQAGQNTTYRFDFYTNGRFIWSENGKSGFLKKGTYTNGGKKMVLDSGESYEESTVWNNMQAIIKQFGK